VLTDAERAFSKGRREVNFMQHNMSSQTSKAEMAVGSWDGTPLMPNISEAISIMEKHIQGGRLDNVADSDGAMSM
jgi:hypothetical protein